MNPRVGSPRWTRAASDLSVGGARHQTSVAMLADMDAVGQEAQLRGFEFAKAVTLTAEPFSIENGLLTPTLKLKRPQAKAYFTGAVADMYAEVSAKQASQFPLRSRL